MNGQQTTVQAANRAPGSISLFDAITAPKIKHIASVATRTPSKITTKQTQELEAAVMRHIEPRGGKVK